MNTTRVLSDILTRHKDSIPDKCAIMSDSNAYSFLELDILSTNFAHVLVNNFGICKGDRIVFIAEKSTELIAAIIATWKAGAVYVPIDKENGINRSRFMINDVNPRLVISSSEYLTKYKDAISGCDTVDYNFIKSLSKAIQGSALPIKVEEQDTAVIIYTSGSSGMPKGVCLSHQSVVDYFQAENDLLQFDQTTNNINFGPFHFDVSIQDTFLPISFGSGVYLYNSFLIPTLIVDLVQQFDVTHLICISSVFTLITGDDKAMEALNNSRLQCCMVGGEVLDNKVVNYWLSKIKALRFYNGYGPTECNSLCMAYHIQHIEEDRKRLYPIGKPFNGSKALLVDQENNAIHANNTIGKLLIGGRQLMQGYWKLSEQTAKAFHHINGEKYYITGDLAQRDNNGNYIFEGRNDSEVKILGRRINLNEIRDNVLKIPQVNYSVIDMIEINGEKEIYAYIYVPEGEAALSEEAVIAHMKENVPVYMIPKHIFITGKVFKTRSKKISEKKIREYINQHYFQL